MKPKILACCLTSSERTGWVNPRLCESLLLLQRDTRFDVTVRMVTDLRPFHYARNTCIKHARTMGAAYCIQFDNDICPPANFADILQDAIRTDKAIVSLSYGVHLDTGWTIIPGPNGRREGNFRTPGASPGGVLIVRSDVWKKIRGPWFLWESRTDDELGGQEMGEDYFFCHKAMLNGFEVWTHDSEAGHLKTVDVTPISKRQGLGPLPKILCRIGPPLPNKTGFAGVMSKLGMR